MKEQYQEPIEQRALDAASKAAARVAAWQPWLEEEDLYQEAILRIYEAVRRSPEYGEHTWDEQFAYLVAAGTSGCVDYYRRVRRHHFNREPESLWPDHGESPERQAAMNERYAAAAETLSIAVAKMSPREEEAILWWLGVGQKPEIKKRTLYTYLERARAKLRSVAKWRRW